ncbi:LOW QUALITY PROTEIN: WD repeat-containing protein 88 [Pluvialis apricaria]
MAVGSGAERPWAPLPPAEPSPAEGRWGPASAGGEGRGWWKPRVKNIPNLCSVPLQIHFKILRGHSDAVSSCHFCFEDRKILSSSYDRTVKLWDVEKSFPIQVFEEGHTAPISECNLTPDDRRVVTSYDNTVKAWDMETGKMLWTVEHEGIVTSCNVSCDGRYVVSGSDKENTMYVFDAISATAVSHIQGHHKSTITRCCFHPDNKRVTSVSAKTIKLWDMTTQSTSIAINEGHSSAISDCCFTWDKSLKIWDIKMGEFQCHEPVSLSQGHEGSVSSCLFSQDASLVVSGGYDKTIAIWDTETGYKKLSLKGHWDWVTDVAISKNKKWILSASKDSTLRLWNIEKMDHILQRQKAEKQEAQKLLSVKNVKNISYASSVVTLK